MELFRVFGTIGLEDGEAKKKLRDIDSEAQGLTGKLTKTGVAIGTAFGNLIAKGVVKLGESIVGIGPSLVTAAANADALGAQFEQVFGDLEDNATSAMNKIAEETGILPNRLKGSFAQMAAFAKTTGASTADALSLTERATLAAADSAAFYDRSIEDVTESLQSFLKGEIVAPRYCEVA